MTSPRRIDANRRNARASTGPRTAAGKARARMNAVRHGLASVRIADGPASDPVAMASDDLARVAAAEARLAGQFLAAGRESDWSAVVRDEARAARAGLLAAMVRLQRYRRAALARRRRALAEYFRSRVADANASGGSGFPERTRCRRTRGRRSQNPRPSRLLARPGRITGLRLAGLRARYSLSRLTWWRLGACLRPRRSRWRGSGRVEAYVDGLVDRVHAIALRRGGRRTRLRLAPGRR